MDLADGKLFVAALEKNTLEVVDLTTGKRVDQVGASKSPRAWPTFPPPTG